MTTVTIVAGVLLAVAGAGAVIRAIRGPTVTDRMVALDTLLFVGIGALGVQVYSTGDTTYVPVLVVAVLIAFASTVVVARYIEAETDRS